MARAGDLTGCYISAIGREVVTQGTGKDKSFLRLPRIPGLHDVSLNLSVLTLRCGNAVHLQHRRLPSDVFVLNPCSVF